MKHNTPEDWELFLSTLIGGNAKLKVSIDERTDTVTVNAQNPASDEKLKRFVEKPWLARKHLAVQIQKQGEEQIDRQPVMLDEGVPLPAKIPETAEEGKSFLQNLFKHHSDEVFWKIADGELMESSTVLLWKINVKNPDLEQMHNSRMA